MSHVHIILAADGLSSGGYACHFINCIYYLIHQASNAPNAPL